MENNKLYHDAEALKIRLKLSKSPFAKEGEAVLEDILEHRFLFYSPADKDKFESFLIVNTGEEIFVPPEVANDILYDLDEPCYKRQYLCPFFNMLYVTFCVGSEADPRNDVSCLVTVEFFNEFVRTRFMFYDRAEGKLVLLWENEKDSLGWPKFPKLSED